jgi:hypothetical protein
MYVDLRKSAIQVTALLLVPLSVAFGQFPEDSGTGIRIFAPLYFQEFDPLNALDMVNQLPGVNLQETNGGRGLSGVRSNLLINGKRPPPKGKSAQERLQQMPVKGVAAIELIDAGARLDLDMQGFPQVINVVTVDDSSAYYEIVTEVQHSGTGEANEENERDASLEGTGKFLLGPHEFTVTASAQDRTSGSPVSLVTIDPANPVQRYSSLNNADRTDEELKFDAIFSLPGNSSLTFNSELTSETQGSRPELQGTVDVIDEGSDRDDELRDFSTEYRRPLASKGELMVALVDTTSTTMSEAFYRDSTSSRSSISESETGETAARLLVTNSPTDRLTIRTNVNNAFNYFDGGFQIFENGGEITISGSDSRVEEHRRALESSVDWVLTEKWNFRGTVGVEQYEITTRNVSSGTQTDPKGEIAISFKPQPRTTFTLSTSRSVGQLAFGQFLASSSLSSEILSAGASALEPERQRTHTASYDRRFSDRGVMRFSLSRTETENPVNTVALSDSLTVSQNTSPSIVDTLQASVDFPLDRFGMEDMILSIGTRFSDSEMIDPITGEAREVSSGGNFNNNGGNANRGGNFNGNFNGFVPKHLKQIELRKDPGDGRWSWSVSARDVKPTANYSTRQVRDSTGENRWNASVTFEPKSGLRLRADIEGPREQIRITNFYPGVRQIGLDPWYIAEATTSRGSQTSFTVEWRGQRFEVTGSLTSRSDVEVVETLTPFGALIGTLAIAETARTPRAMLRFRVRN